MRWIDLHCDVLSKLLKQPELSFRDDKRLDVTLQGLQVGHVGLQSFAIYIPQGSVDAYHCALQEIDLLHSHVLSEPIIQLVTNRETLRRAFNGPVQERKIGALLTLEGAGCLRGDMMRLRTLHRLGVRMVGLTWNEANWAADGVMEPRGGGLTRMGREMVRECERLRIMLDVSHLSERGFWELADMAVRPFLASHSNSFSICPHPRNLKDDQIKEMISRNGVIGLTFVPWFIRAAGPVQPEHLLPHIEHICSLGGERQLAIGSDWDGIDQWVVQLERPERLLQLQELLHRHYSKKVVEDLVWRNAYRYLESQLPV